MTCGGGVLHDSDCAGIVRAVRAARATHSFEYGALRAVVMRCADNARRSGCPPERFLIAIKSCLPDDGSLAMSRWTRDIIKDRVVTWAIAGYYAASGAA